MGIMVFGGFSEKWLDKYFFPGNQEVRVGSVFRRSQFSFCCLQKKKGGPVTSDLVFLIDRRKMMTQHRPWTTASCCRSGQSNRLSPGGGRSLESCFMFFLSYYYYYFCMILFMNFARTGRLWHFCLTRSKMKLRPSCCQRCNHTCNTHVQIDIHPCNRTETHANVQTHKSRTHALVC